MTPLHYAARDGQFDVACCLLEKKADLDLKDKYGVRTFVWILSLKYSFCSISVIL